MYLSGFTDSSIVVLLLIATIPFIATYFLLRLLIKSNNLFPNLRNKNSPNKTINSILYNIILVAITFALVFFVLFVVRM